MNKKLMSAFMVGVLSLGLLFGCSSEEVEENKYSEPSVQQEEIIENEEREEGKEEVAVVEEQPTTTEQPSVDEELDPSYFTEEQQSNIDKAYEILKPTLDKYLSENGIQYELIKEENTIIVSTYLPTSEIVNTILYDVDTWNVLVDNFENVSLQGKKALENLGIYDVNVGFMLGDKSTDKAYLGVVNGEVVYNGADKLN